MKNVLVLDYVCERLRAVMGFLLLALASIFVPLLYLPDELCNEFHVATLILGASTFFVLLAAVFGWSAYRKSKIKNEPQVSQWAVVRKDTEFWTLSSTRRSLADKDRIDLAQIDQEIRTELLVQNFEDWQDEVCISQDFTAHLAKYRQYGFSLVIDPQGGTMGFEGKLLNRRDGQSDMIEESPVHYEYVFDLTLRRFVGGTKFQEIPCDMKACEQPSEIKKVMFDGYGKDDAGIWHYQRSGGTLYRRAIHALSEQPEGTKLYWFNKGWCPILPGDTVETLTKRFQEWNFKDEEFGKWDPALLVEKFAKFARLY